MLSRTLSIFCLLAIALPGLAAADHITRVLDFDPVVGELPEGVAVDKRGNIYVTLAPRGEVLRLDTDGEVEVIAQFDVGGGFAVGMTVDAPGNVYVCIASFNPANHGVWRIGRDGGLDHILPMPPDTLPNDLVFDNRGNLYVTDSIGGAVWRLDRRGNGGLWLQDESLTGLAPQAPLPFPIGANGIAYRHGALYVANLQRGTIVGVEIGRRGEPGALWIDAEDPALVGADGIAFEARGGLFVAVNGQNSVVRVEDGEVALVVDGLDAPATLAFGSGRGERRTLYITNFAIFSGPGGDPALLSIDAGVPGQPVP